jgi:arylsulfatase A-like enzyme
VGQILKALDENGVAGNTLLVVTSDNGSFMYRLGDPSSPTKPDEEGRDHVAQPGIQGYLPENHQANGIFRGTKADIWEAGHRVPFLVRWPGHTPAGSTCETPVCLTDLMATVAELLGQKLPDAAAEDSDSILALLRGKPLPTPRPAIVHHSANGTFAIRQRQWKLILGSGSGGRGVPGSKPFEGEVQLYDIARDPSETTNQAGQHPEVVKELTALLESFRNSGRSL